MTKHTPEPWTVQPPKNRLYLAVASGRFTKCAKYPGEFDGEYERSGQSWHYIAGPSGPSHFVADVVVANGEREGPDEDGRANLDRIVTCVNALAGIDDPAAFVERAKRMEEALRECARADADCGDAVRELARAALNGGAQ